MNRYSYSTQEVLATLSDAGVKPSSQRMAILRFLMENRIHPTVDEIFKALQPEHPTLSRTTVYNTLRLLSGAGVIRCIETGEGARWDFSHHDHAHFLCVGCGTLTDVDFTEQSVLPVPPGGFETRSVDLLFKGICPSCSAS